MAIVPLDTRFIGIAPQVDLTERKSALLNAETSPYSMQDIIDTAEGRLVGTSYVYVPADGTDTENAAQLQAAYDEAVIMATPVVATIPISPFTVFNPTIIGIDVSQSYLFPNGATVTMVVDGITYNAIVAVNFGTFIDFQVGTIDFTGATTIDVISVEIPTITVIAAPGNYDFASDFVMDTEGVNLVSLTGNRDVIFNGTGTLSVTADGVFIKGIDVEDKNFTIANDLSSLVVENCAGGDFSFGGDPTYGSNPIIVSGTFIDCVGGFASFGIYGTASGTFTNCVGGDNSFGAYGTASGTFTNCEGGSPSFGGIASGVFTNCKGTNSSFAEASTASGTFTNCVINVGGFGSYGTANGVFRNCVANGYAFGNYGTASGVFYNCTSTTTSFGKSGTLSGKLFYCCLSTSGSGGTFQTVSGGGRTFYCIDGNDTPNNQ